MATDRRKALRLLTAMAVTPVFAHSIPRRSIALLFDSLVSPFWVMAIESFRRQIASRGWVVLEAVSNMDDNRQYTQVKSMIERGVEGMVIVHTDDKAVIPAIRAANAAGVPMIHFNRAPASSDAYSVSVVADNRKLMDDTVSALISIARREPRHYRAAILLGNLADANGVDRRNGFNEAIARHSDIVEVVAQIATEWNADKAFAGLSSALQAHPDIDLLVTSSDFLVPQIEQALRIAGKWYPAGTTGHVLIAGFDGDDNGYREVAAGFFDVDGVQNLNYQVKTTLEAFERLWRGERLPRVLVDPGFVISRETLVARRSEMWGYELWKEKSAALVRSEAVGRSLPQASIVSPRAMGSRATATGAALGPTASGVADASHVWIGALALAAVAGAGKTLFSGAALHDIVLAMLPLSILVLGQMLVLLIGQIDLSMTAVMAVGSIAAASVMTRISPGIGEVRLTILGLVAFVTVGALIGLFNGVCSAILRVPSFIGTLAVMMAGSGGAVWYASSVSDSMSIGGLPRAFRLIGYGTEAGIPIALIISTGALAGIHWVLTRTVTGRWVYALGQNAEVARISGVPVRQLTVAVFVVSGVCAGIAGAIYTSRIETGLPTLGQNMLLDIVGAAVIGGVSLFGGRGSIWMVLAGVAFLCMLDKSLQLLGLPLFIVLAVKGMAILAAALIDLARRRRWGRA
jgi:ribose/xylose/arabinose/galactoside ABC-type transport system permease subunit/ABC-type sugar transport system substrate-binding protein